MFLTCFVRGSHQWTTGCVNKAHIIPNFLPVRKLLWSDVFLHLKAKHTLSQCALRHQICSTVALITVEPLHQVPWFLPSGGVWWAACTDPVSDSPLWPLAALQTTAWSGKWLYFTSQNISGSMSVCVTGEFTHQSGCLVSVGQSRPVRAWWTSWWARWIWPFWRASGHSETGQS